MLSKKCYIILQIYYNIFARFKLNTYLCYQKMKPIRTEPQPYKIGPTIMKTFEILDLMTRNGFTIVHTSDNKIKITRGGLFRVFANIEAAYNYYFGICL